MIKKNKALILVADDYEVNRQIVRLMLQKAGYVVDAVENGQQAVEACRRKQYDLILMDIQMPIMDGHEATKRIRKWEVGSGNAACDELSRIEVGNKEAKTWRHRSEDRNQMSDVRRKMTDEIEKSTQFDQRDEELGGGNKIRENSDTDSTFRIPTSDFNGVPIIAMTGHTGEGSFDEKQYPGMNDCIGKPMQFDRLLAVVQKWLCTKPAPLVNEYPAGASDPIAMGSEEKQFPLDLDRAIQEFMGKKEILLGVLQKFIITAAARIDNIRQAVKTTDYHAIGLEAHGLKGGAANLTADKLANLAADLEKAGKEQQPDLTAELAEKLAQEFCNLEKYVRQIPELIATN